MNEKHDKKKVKVKINKEIQKSVRYFGRLMKKQQN